MDVLAAFTVFSSYLALALLLFVHCRLFWLLNRHTHPVEQVLIASLPFCLFGLGVFVGTLQEGALRLIASRIPRPNVIVFEGAYAAILYAVLLGFLLLVGSKGRPSLRPVLWIYAAAFTAAALLLVLHLLPA